MLIDTHCHLDLDWFDGDRDDVVARAKTAGVERIIVPAIDLHNCEAVLALADRYDGVFAAVGVHPNSSAEWDDAWIETLRAHASHEKVVAIGEIGLDYYRNRSPKSTQRRALFRQLELAAELRLPVILHNRESSEDLIRFLSDSPLAGRERPGVLHSFAASLEVARIALDMGFYLGFTGPVTYKKADGLRKVVSDLPAERFLVETDAPFLPPQKYRGKRNEPAYVTLVADAIAGVRGVDPGLIADITSENALKLFGTHLQ